jgi:hypothetical protein
MSQPANLQTPRALSRGNSSDSGNIGLCGASIDSSKKLPG